MNAGDGAVEEDDDKINVGVNEGPEDSWANYKLFSFHSHVT